MMELCETCGYFVLITFPIFRKDYVMHVCKECYDKYEMEEERDNGKDNY